MENPIFTFATPSIISKVEFFLYCGKVLTSYLRKTLSVNFVSEKAQLLWDFSFIDPSLI